MIESNQIEEVLKKTQAIEKQIADNKQRSQEISNKLIELNTQKQLILKDLETFGVTEATLDSKIEELYASVRIGIEQFEAANK